jgi:hypothetical protein
MILDLHTTYRIPENSRGEKGNFKEMSKSRNVNKPIMRLASKLEKMGKIDRLAALESLEKFLNNL